MRLRVPALILIVGGGGCVADGRIHYGVSAAVVAPAPVVVVSTPPPPPPQPVYVQPELVEVSPGVQVIYDYDEPIFFSGGLYWRQTNGYWYSSSVHTGGWGRVEAPPPQFRSIQANAYVHYRPAGYQPRQGPVVRDQRAPMTQPGPAVRDHREPTYAPTPAPAPGPVVRDHREPAPVAAPVAAPAPVVRDHRAPAPPPPPPPKPVVRDHRD